MFASPYSTPRISTLICSSTEAISSANPMPVPDCLP
jgi:hypothetical protein